MNPATPPQKKSKLPMILIGGGITFMVMLAICGILTAIAIPAFLRYTNKSKGSEADINIMRVTMYAQAYWESTCQFPDKMPPTNDLEANCGGLRSLPNVDGVEDPELQSIFLDPTYFIYTTTVSEQGGDRVYSVRAQADFDCASPEVHTVEARVIGRKNGDVCTAEILPTLTTNEFE